MSYNMYWFKTLHVPQYSTAKTFFNLSKSRKHCHKQRQRVIKNNSNNNSSQQFPSSWDQQNQQSWQQSQIVQEDVLDDWIENPYEGPRGIGQKILALALAALLTGSLLNIFWRLFVIGYVLLSAAFKYSVVAILVVVIALFIA